MKVAVVIAAAAAALAVVALIVVLTVPWWTDTAINGETGDEYDARVEELMSEVRSSDWGPPD